MLKNAPLGGGANIVGTTAHFAAVLLDRLTAHAMSFMATSIPTPTPETLMAEMAAEADRLAEAEHLDRTLIRGWACSPEFVCLLALRSAMAPDQILAILPSFYPGLSAEIVLEKLRTMPGLRHFFEQNLAVRRFHGMFLPRRLATPPLLNVPPPSTPPPGEIGTTVLNTPPPLLNMTSPPMVHVPNMPLGLGMPPAVLNLPGLPPLHLPMRAVSPAGPLTSPRQNKTPFSAVEAEKSPSSLVGKELNFKKCTFRNKVNREVRGFELFCDKRIPFYADQDSLACVPKASNFICGTVENVMHVQTTDDNPFGFPAGVDVFVLRLSAVRPHSS